MVHAGKGYDNKGYGTDGGLFWIARISHLRMPSQHNSSSPGKRACYFSNPFISNAIDNLVFSLKDHSQPLRSQITTPEAQSATEDYAIVSCFKILFTWTLPPWYVLCKRSKITILSLPSTQYFIRCWPEGESGSLGINFYNGLGGQIGERYEGKALPLTHFSFSFYFFLLELVLLQSSSARFH